MDGSPAGEVPSPASAAPSSSPQPRWPPPLLGPCGLHLPPPQSDAICTKLAFIVCIFCCAPLALTDGLLCPGSWRGVGVAAHSPPTPTVRLEQLQCLRRAAGLEPVKVYALGSPREAPCRRDPSRTPLGRQAQSQRFVRARSSCQGQLARRPSIKGGYQSFPLLGSRPCSCFKLASFTPPAWKTQRKGGS